MIKEFVNMVSVEKAVNFLIHVFVKSSYKVAIKLAREIVINSILHFVKRNHVMLKIVATDII